MHDIKESDWKVFRQLREIALDRFCRRILDEIRAISEDTGRSPHERYLATYELTRRRDREIADAFNDPRRSRAYIQLLYILSLDLLTEEELSRFGPEMQASLKHRPR
jgi:hypothetical protein